MKKRLTDFVRETIDISHINRADLCRGLCSVSALSKYLNQERKMDRLLLTAILNGGRTLQLRNWQETGQGCRNCWRIRRRTRSAMQHCKDSFI